MNAISMRECHRACSIYDYFKIQDLIHDFRVLMTKNETSGYYINISGQKRILSKIISKIIEHCVTQHSIII